VKERGFTLVEMLVALAIFAAIASIGVGLLRTSVATQEAVQARLGSMGAVNRLRAIMAADLAQAALRPMRDERGAALPAFAGRSDGFAVVHRGTGVQRAAYALADGGWTRATTPGDGLAAGAADMILPGVTGAALRYRDAVGNWRDSWSSDAERRLPVAVEVALIRASGTRLVLRFATAPTLPPPVVAAP
jgi:general secretion pathway protein J